MARLKNHGLAQVERLPLSVPGAMRLPGCGCCLNSQLLSIDSGFLATAGV